MDLRDEVMLRHFALDWTTVLRAAERIASNHNEKIGCRSADLFHVAAASATGHDIFVTFDERQKALAEAAGLRVEV